MSSAGEPWISDDLVVLVRPFRGYARAHEAATPGAWTLLRGPLRWLLVIGAFVALTTAGRLAWYHVVLPATVWAVFPAMQSAWVLVAARAMRSRAPASVVIDLYFRGHGVWYLLLIVVAAVCLLAPEPAEVLEAVSTAGLVMPIFVCATALSTWVTYAMFRAGLALSRSRAIGALAIFLLGYGGGIVAWFWLTGQLPPLVLEVP